MRNPDREEEATDLIAVFLGFGVFLLNASDQFDTSSEWVGASVTTSVRLGYLSPIALAYALAVQAIVRGLTSGELKTIAGHLRANQRASFEAALKELRGESAFLRERLKMPDPTTWPEPRAEPLTIPSYPPSDRDVPPLPRGALRGLARPLRAAPALRRSRGAPSSRRARRDPRRGGDP